MKRPDNYHEYVFKDGKLIGKFDDMYKFSSETPWHQDDTAFRTFAHIDIAILKQFSYGSVCEAGCGLGYFTNRLFKELDFDGSKPIVKGIDISKTAVIKASKKFPGITFIAADLLKKERLPKEQFDLVIVKDVMWYVSHKLDLFMDNVLRLTKNKGFFYISQSFPNDATWVGKERINSPETLKRIFSRYASIIHYCVEYNDPLYKNGYIHILGKVSK